MIALPEVPVQAWSCLLLLFAFALLACDEAAVPPPQPEPTAPPAVEQVAAPPAVEVAEPAPLADVAEPPATDPTPVSAPALPTDDGGERMAVRHILVAWTGAVGAPVNVHRSEGGAREKAEALRARILAGEDFATLAKQESDDASRSRGGFLGGFGHGAMVPTFEQAAFALPVGGVSAVVESPFGFHIIQREPLEEIRVAQILIQWQGAPGSGVTRSRQEALVRAENAWAQLQEGGALEDIARAWSDGAAGLRGGDLGWFTRGQFLPAWEERAFALAPGETSPPFETSVGVHIVRRLE